ncbi:hypothetical protein FJY90_01640 [Candidatus Gottesmanbacteria bacterium]|nr:hypothetical protein [Candidatus Gottesmanbacteria bacterium]
MHLFSKKKIHHYFVPHESNNYRARTLHHSSIIFYIFTLIIFQAGVNFIKHSHPRILGYATDIAVERIYSLVNQKRAEANLPPLELSSELSIAATQKAADMLTKNYWAHVSPTGVTPWAFITSSGYNYSYAGENLAKDFNTSREVVEAWMNSPSHRANILKPEYSEIGLAVMDGTLNGEETTLIVQHFGTKSTNAAVISQSQTPSLSRQVSLQDGISQPDNNQAMLNQRTTSVRLSPLSISKKFSLTLTEFLLIILFIDSLYIWRSKKIRITGHSLAHVIFLIALIGAMSATGIGVIL